MPKLNRLAIMERRNKIRELAAIGTKVNIMAQDTGVSIDQIYHDINAIVKENAKIFTKEKARAIQTAYVYFKKKIIDLERQRVRMLQEGDGRGALACDKVILEYWSQILLICGMKQGEVQEVVKYAIRWAGNDADHPLLPVQPPDKVPQLVGQDKANARGYPWRQDNSGHE